MSLLDYDVRQGAILNCAKISDECQDGIKNGRALTKARNSKLRAKKMEPRSLLILSQDCDISSTNNQYIELVALRPINTISSRVSRNQNYSKLQFTNDGQCWEAEAKYVSVIPKDLLENEFKNSLTTVSSSLNDKNLTKIIDWRVGCYNRRPFPHKFNTAFLFDYIKQENNELGNFLDCHEDDILGLYLYVNPMDDEDAELYTVIVNGVIFKKGHDDEAIANEQRFKFQFDEVLRSALTELETEDNGITFPQITGLDIDLPYDDIHLELVIEEDNFTLYDARAMTLFNLDYFCYNDDENHE